MDVALLRHGYSSAPEIDNDSGQASQILISVSLSVAGQSVPHADYYEIAGMLSRNRIQSNGEVVS